MAAQPTRLSSCLRRGDEPGLITSPSLCLIIEIFRPKSKDVSTDAESWTMGMQVVGERAVTFLPQHRKTSYLPPVLSNCSMLFHSASQGFTTSIRRSSRRPSGEHAGLPSAQHSLRMFQVPRPLGHDSFRHPPHPSRRHPRTPGGIFVWRMINSCEIRAKPFPSHEYALSLLLLPIR